MKGTFNTNILYPIKMCIKQQTEPFLTHEVTHLFREISTFVYRQDLPHTVPNVLL